MGNADGPFETRGIYTVDSKNLSISDVFLEEFRLRVCGTQIWGRATQLDQVKTGDTVLPFMHNSKADRHENICWHSHPKIPTIPHINSAYNKTRRFECVRQVLL